MFLSYVQGATRIFSASLESEMEALDLVLASKLDSFLHVEIQAYEEQQSKLLERSTTTADSRSLLSPSHSSSRSSGTDTTSAETLIRVPSAVYRERALKEYADCLDAFVIKSKQLKRKTDSVPAPPIEFDLSLMGRG